MGILNDQLLIFADEIADKRQSGTPDAGSEQSVQGELEMIHSCHTGWN